MYAIFIKKYINKSLKWKILKMNHNKLKFGCSCDKCKEHVNKYYKNVVKNAEYLLSYNSPLPEVAYRNKVAQVAAIILEPALDMYKAKKEYELYHIIKNIIENKHKWT